MTSSTLFEQFQGTLLRGPKALLTLAREHNCSDLHISPKGKHYEIKIRQAGRLNLVGTLGVDTGRELVQALKAASKMNIAETRKPQDARLELEGLQSRLATHPSLHGENLVIRLLGDHFNTELAHANFSQSALQRIKQLLHRDQGLTIVAGATGSGKTTTLHAMLHELGEQAGSVITLEDPVEIINNNATQTDLSRLPHLDFAGGLRSIMRQDPDTILVGEIRDIETAELTLHAALTGHRVFASLHAPDSCGALYRLIELGIRLSSLMNCFNGIVCQRLIVDTQKTTRRPWAEVLNFNYLNRADLLQEKDISTLFESGGQRALWTFADDLKEIHGEATV